MQSTVTYTSRETVSPIDLLPLPSPWSRDLRYASGDCSGQLRVWNQRDGALDWAVDAPLAAGHTASVEDVQWSPTEPTVLASCGADHAVRIWDIREPTRPMISVAAHECDVNVISWNRLVSYLMVSGADDGSFKVWDLRKFQDPCVFVRSFVRSARARRCARRCS